MLHWMNTTKVDDPLKFESRSESYANADTVVYRKKLSESTSDKVLLFSGGEYTQAFKTDLTGRHRWIWTRTCTWWLRRRRHA
jgi:hypothetical protein